jgi:hypothetical protein
MGKTNQGKTDSKESKKYLKIDDFDHEDLAELEREIYRRSLFKTAKFLLQMHDVNMTTHGDTIEALEELEYRRKGCPKALIVLPRGSLKSSVASIAFPVWRLLRDPNKRILIDSATYDLSTQLVSAIAQHLESPRVVGLFGTFKSRGDWSSKSLTIAQRTKILATPSIAAGGVGSPKVGSHFDSIICDDLNTDKNSTTPELRQKVFDHYRMNFAILDPGGDMALVGTRYSADDCIGRVLSDEIGVGEDGKFLPDYLKSDSN